MRHDQSRYSFDSAGRLSGVVDVNGEGVALAYDVGGHLDTVTDSVGRVESFASNPDGTLQSITLSDGRTVSFAYTGGRLTSVTGVDGKTDDLFLRWRRAAGDDRRSARAHGRLERLRHGRQGVAADGREREDDHVRVGCGDADGDDHRPERSCLEGRVRQQRPGRADRPGRAHDHVRPRRRAEHLERRRAGRVEDGDDL